MPSIVSVRSAFPPNEFTQEEVGELLGVQNEVVHRLLRAPHIQTRRLAIDVLPRKKDRRDDEANEGEAAGDASTAGGAALLRGHHSPMPRDTLSSLHRRFLHGVQTFGFEAATSALAAAGTRASDVGVVVTVTSSGLALPGISAMLMRHQGLSPRAHRSELVGMGCNAGLSGLRTLSQLLAAHPPGTVGLLLCVEVSSALHVRDDSVGTGIVNSLFGDAAVAAVLVAGPPARAFDAAAADESVSATGLSSQEASLSGSANTTPREAPTLASAPTPAVAATSDPAVELLDFECQTFPEFFDDMRYEVNPAHELYSFKLSKRIPQVVGDAVVGPVVELLRRNRLAVADVQHWVVHSGGAAVMDGVVRNLGIPDSAIRHTRSVLRDFGNISSASFLVSFERLLQEHHEQQQQNQQEESPVLVKHGDTVVLIAMGPGTTIEVGLGRFSS